VVNVDLLTVVMQDNDIACRTSRFSTGRINVYQLNVYQLNVCQT